MATRQATVDHILEQTNAAGDVRATRMFGEYGLYCDGRMVALICDDQLFVKPTPAGRAVAGPVDEGVPYPGAKPCPLIAGEHWDDAERLSDLIRVTAAELPLPVRKSKGR